MADQLKPETAERALEQLGFSIPPAIDKEGLDLLYTAWCRAVPFDNVRKRIALLEDDRGPLPGITGEDFYTNLFAHGTSGTCWPSSNALFLLIEFCGFDARRVVGSMQDGSDENHGSVAVRFDGVDYLADTAMSTEHTFPLRELETGDPLHPIRVEPVDGTLRIHWAMAMGDGTIPCRLLRDPVDHPYYTKRYEVTRDPDKSPFNRALYATRNSEAAVLSYMGKMRFWKRPEGVESAELSPREMAESLVTELGLSEEIVARLERAGGLA